MFALKHGKLFYFTNPHPDLPIDERYVAETDTGIKESFVHKNDALLFLFDHGVRSYQSFTKEISVYKNLKNIPIYELWHLENRIGYVLFGFESYIDSEGNINKRKSYIWRFVGHGRSCFAPTREELTQKILDEIHKHVADPEERGYNIYPYYTRYYREGGAKCIIS